LTAYGISAKNYVLSLSLALKVY